MNSKQKIDLSSTKAVARALAKVRRPEVDTHILRNGIHTEHTLLIQSIYFFQFR